MTLNWKNFKKLKENEEDQTGIEEPEYEQDHGHGEADENSEGGLEPENEEELRRYKHADLITLPAGVQGTNCGNCKFMDKIREGLGWCNHPDLEMYVTPRMCCVYWDHDGVKRSWGDEQLPHEE